jgi:hypothetical protein
MDRVAGADADAHDGIERHGGRLDERTLFVAERAEWCRLI